MTPEQLKALCNHRLSWKDVEPPDEEPSLSDSGITLPPEFMRKLADLWEKAEAWDVACREVEALFDDPGADCDEGIRKTDECHRLGREIFAALAALREEG